MPRVLPWPLKVWSTNQQQVNSNNHNRARKLDEDEGFDNGEGGPFANALKQYGVEGLVGAIMHHGCAQILHQELVVGTTAERGGVDLPTVSELQPWG